MSRRGYGTGTITRLANGRYRMALMVRGKRVWRRADTYGEAVAGLEALRNRVDRGRTDGLRAHTRRVRVVDWIGALLAEGRTQGWDDAYLARVLAAQLAPRRVKRAVFGPCAYCGTWIAATVDHIIPTAAGGSDEADNLASACWTCNSRKGAKLDHSWSISLPPDEVDAA